MFKTKSHKQILSVLKIKMNSVVFKSFIGIGRVDEL